jgi:hypothetical protein
LPNPFSRSLLSQAGSPAFLVPCVVSSVTPLRVSLLGAENVAAVKVAGATYSLGAANALVVSGSSPVVLPIG